MNLLCRVSVIVLANVLTLTALAQTRAGDSVDGKVLNEADGHPMANALVTLEQTASNNTFATVYTGEDGTFHFDGVPRGKYRLRGQASGFSPSLYLQHHELSTAIVTGAGLDTSSLTLKLTPSASISGHVLDDTGEPIVRANIILYRRQAEGEDRIAHFRNSFANDENTFDFGGLPPGRYFLAVTATPWYAVHPPLEQPEAVVMFRSSVDPALDVTYPMTFYPAATVDREASPIDLKPGDDFIADVHLTPVHALSITLPSTESSPSNRNRRVFGYSLSRTVFGHTENVMMQMEGFNDVQRITGLAPGLYDLRSNLQGTASRDLGPVTLSSDAVTLASQPSPAARSASVHVTVHTPEGVAVVKNTSLSLYQRGDSSAMNLNQPLDAKNSADFSEIPAGEYRFGIYSPGLSPNPASLQVNGQDVPTKVLRIAGTDTLQVDLTLGGKPTSIEGSVHDADGKAFVPSMVILVPAGKDTNPDLFRRDQTDLDGSFTLPNVLPGNYLLLAIDDAWEIRWNDSATVTPYLLHAIPVTVQAGGPQVFYLKETIVSQPR